MKILLSAYACEPNRGSEPGVGWNWAIELAKLGHDTWVLTRANNRTVIKQKFANEPHPPNLHFVYYDCPAWVRRFKKGSRGVHFYYLCWQWGGYKAVKYLHSKECFDLVHHVTFVGVRQPSFMGNLGIPFIFGPVAGGESAPWHMRFQYGLGGFVIDAIRDVLNFIVRIDPLMWRTFKQAQEIYVTSEQTKQLIPKQFHKKVKIQIAIAIDNGSEHYSPTIRMEDKNFKILYVGRFLYWKGMTIGLKAFAKYLNINSNATLTMVGKGPYKRNLQNIATKLEINNKINWIEWVDQKKLSEIYLNHDVLLFPSYHDSGGMVVLEAMSFGKPVICLNLGGPGVIVDNSCGRKINPFSKTAPQIIANITKELLSLSQNKSLLETLSKGAAKRALEYNWSEVVKKIYF